MTKMVRGCKTRTDAFLRVLDARMSSNINPTEEYLLELRKRLYDWIQRVDEELIIIARRKVRESVCDNAAE